MKALLLVLSLLVSLPSFAGEMYLTCGFGEEGHWEEFTDSTLSRDHKGLVTLKQGITTYVVTYDNDTFRYIKGDTNNGGFEEKVLTIEGSPLMDPKHIVDDIWCHTND
jgi:hypothetical protein